MTVKTAEKNEPRSQRAAPSQDEVHAAYQCHTLSTILFGQIAATHPWLTRTPCVPVQPTFGSGATPWGRSWPGRV